MAFTVTKKKQSVWGDQRVWHGLVTADATTGVVSFGMGVIEQVLTAPSSMSTAFAGNFKINEDTVGGSSPGDLGISGVVSGDDIYVTVIGR